MLTSMVLMLALAAAEPAAEGAAPAKTAAERDKEVVCAKFTPTGSVIGQKVCKTRKAWRKLEERQKRQADQALDPSNQSTRAKE